MNNQTLNLIKQYANLEALGDQPIESIPLWELRDNMSHNLKIKLDDREQSLVDGILDHITRGNDFSWEPKLLTIAGEAKVQASLRLKGFDLKCFDLNIFPTNTKDLHEHLDKYSAVETFKIKKDHVKNTIQKYWQFIKEWYPKQYYVFFGLFSIIGYAYAVWARPDLLIYSLIMAWAFCNMSAILIHEWWTHDLVEPKNRVLHFIFDLFGHCLFLTPRLKWRFEHRWHHKNWKTDKDIDYHFLNTPVWFYLLFATPIQTVLKGETNPVPENFLQEREDCYKKNIVKFYPEARFLEKHWVAVPVIANLVLMYLLGFVNYMYFVCGQAFFFRCYIIGFNEIVTHWPLKLTREEESNTPYLFPICCGTAYHKTHHYEPTTIVLGPGKLKYLNIQYWFIKLFFKQSPGTRLS